MLVIAAAMTLASGVIHGQLSSRWGPPSEMLDAAELLDHVPEEFGEWRRMKTNALGREAVDMLQCAGYLNHTYANRHTGTIVNVAVLVGPAGRMSVHIPEICYSGRNYTTTGPRELTRITTADDIDHDFWALSLRANDAGAGQLRVYYAWHDGDAWSAPEQPRFHFAGRPLLYKLQLACSLPPHTDTTSGDPCQAFLHDFLPVLQRHLWTNTQTGSKKL